MASTDTSANDLYDSMGIETPAPKAAHGLGDAVLAMEQYANAMQGLIGALAGLAMSLNEVVMEYSDQESQWLSEQTEILQGLPADATTSPDNTEQQKAITDQQTEIQTGTQVFNAAIATPQTLAEQIQSDTGTMSQQESMLYNNISTVLEINDNLAADLRS